MQTYEEEEEEEEEVHSLIGTFWRKKNSNALGNLKLNKNVSTYPLRVLSEKKLLVLKNPVGKDL